MDNFINREELFEHKLTHIEDLGLWQPVEPDFNFDNEAINDIIRENAGYIFDGHHITDVTSSYNFPITQCVGNEHWIHEVTTIMESVSALYNQEEAFKLNFGFGFILMNKETEEFRYYVPYINNDYFDKPIRIDGPSS
jgi:hypothetical protein